MISIHFKKFYKIWQNEWNIIQKQPITAQYDNTTVILMNVMHWKRIKFILKLYSQCIKIRKEIFE